MSTDLMNVADAEVLSLVPAEAGAVVWATKTGKTKSAWSERAQAAAPSAVRLSVAEQKTAASLAAGRYVAFCRDAMAALTAGHKKALASHLSRAYASMLAEASKGLPVYATVDVDALAEAPSINKAMFRPIAEFMASPQAETAKTISDKPLGKSHQWMSRLAAQWLKAQG